MENPTGHGLLFSAVVQDGKEIKRLSHGPYIIWYPNGKKMEGSYETDKKVYPRFGISAKVEKQNTNLTSLLEYGKHGLTSVLTEEINHDAIPSVTNID